MPFLHYQQQMKICLVSLHLVEYGDRGLWNCVLYLSHGILYKHKIIAVVCTLVILYFYTKLMVSPPWRLQSFWTAPIQSHEGLYIFGFCVYVYIR